MSKNCDSWAGITGLSSAYYLNKQDADLDITVFEAANRPGENSNLSSRWLYD